MFISVTVLRQDGKRLSAYAIKTQQPLVGWLHYDVHDYGGTQAARVKARLINDNGVEMLALDHACLVACHGQRGALIEGVEYRKKGRKHSISDRQSWWCEAPPRTTPLLDQQARALAVAHIIEAQTLAGWGND